LDGFINFAQLREPEGNDFETNPDLDLPSSRIGRTSNIPLSWIILKTKGYAGYRIKEFQPIHHFAERHGYGETMFKNKPAEEE
jgi:hypothetical protein